MLCHSANVGTQMRTSRSLSSSILQGRRGYHGSRGTLSHRLFFYPLNAIYVLNRLHIGHFYLTHSFILRREEAAVGVACGAVITVIHILSECADLLDIRKKYFEERSLYSLFRNVIPEKKFDFLREIGVFNKI